MKNPKTPEEWQDAADLATAFIALDSAQKYGLVTGPTVNVERCESLLRRAEKRGITPRPDAVERVVAGISAETGNPWDAIAEKGPPTVEG